MLGYVDRPFCDSISEGESSSVSFCFPTGYVFKELDVVQQSPFPCCKGLDGEQAQSCLRFKVEAGGCPGVCCCAIG